MVLGGVMNVDSHTGWARARSAVPTLGLSRAHAERFIQTRVRAWARRVPRLCPPYEKQLNNKPGSVVRSSYGFGVGCNSSRS
jgi:hypothetical protein